MQLARDGGHRDEVERVFHEAPARHPRPDLPQRDDLGGVVDPGRGPQQDRLLEFLGKLEGVGEDSVRSSTEEGSSMGSPESLA